MNKLHKELKTITADELQKIHQYWSACNYLAAGMIYLHDNPLLKVPLKPEHVKKRVLGHWGTSPGLSFIYVHLNRLIKKYGLNMIFIAGPGHGAPGVLAPVYLEGTYTEIYPDVKEDEAGLAKLFKRFSFPGGIGSHCTPETPGSIHEGGELGYSLSHAFGAVFDNPDLIAAVVVGDGEAETGPLATSWHSNKFLNPIRDGAVLPILHLNGYKIANPTILARITKVELEHLMEGYGYKPYFVEGDDPSMMHVRMAEVLEMALLDIRRIQSDARTTGIAKRPMWPMIVLRSPKGWTGPKEVGGHKVEGSWRSHQVPLSNVLEDEKQLEQLEEWLLSYNPANLFDDQGRLLHELREIAPEGKLRMSANPSANGGNLRKPLILPDLMDYGLIVSSPGVFSFENTQPLGGYLAEVFRNNPDNFRMFGPDETASNKLQAVFKGSEKTWMAEYFDDDADGGELSMDGKVMEMLSEHTLMGWLEGYLLTGRHGLFHTYEAFAHIVDSMFNQYAKWLDSSRMETPWRQLVSSENILLSSTVWRQDHNGFSHQDPGFLDVVTNKDPEVVRIYLPPDANCLLSITDHCLRSVGYINVIVSDKQKHLQYLNMDEAIDHCKKGIGIWHWAGRKDDVPELVMASCGDVATQEALAATDILLRELPGLRVRFVNIVDLTKLISNLEHPHGLRNEEFDELFTEDCPVILNFHGYPWLIHKLIFGRTNQYRFFVHGYNEKGSINTPLELAMINKIDRFSLVIDALERIDLPESIRSDLQSRMELHIRDNIEYAHLEGVDLQELRDWTWPIS